MYSFYRKCYSHNIYNKILLFKHFNINMKLLSQPGSGNSKNNFWFWHCFCLLGFPGIDFFFLSWSTCFDILSLNTKYNCFLVLRISLKNSLTLTLTRSNEPRSASCNHSQTRFWSQKKRNVRTFSFSLTSDVFSSHRNFPGLRSRVMTWPWYRPMIGWEWSRVLDNGLCLV